MDSGKRKWIITMILMMFMVLHARTELYASTGNVNTEETHQTMEGFGASISWWYGELTTHLNRDQIYYYIFDELGLDILRLRNGYMMCTLSHFQEIVNQMYNYSDHTPIIMMSSWSPPANLKSNGQTGNGGTLKKVNGEYAYDLFADWWIDALDAYDALGIVTDYISIQNEPSFTIQWDSCVFDPTENATNAGYDKALESVYHATQFVDSPPKIIAPEVLGIGYNLFQNYARYFEHDFVDAYAYHLYHGGDGNNNPDAFNSNFSAIPSAYTEKPIFQTEYDYGDWFNTGWLMHNALTYGNVSAYLYWALVMDGINSKGLIRMENPTNQSSWTTDDGYIVSDEYWAFRQYSKFIFAGWQRVGADVDSDNLKMTAFISPEGDRLTLIILNVGQAVEDLDFNIQGFQISNGSVIRTSETQKGEEIDSDYNGTSMVNIPARSITTIVFSGQATQIDEPKQSLPITFSLTQNYPNPFNAVTTIDYSLARAGYVRLKIFDILGREIKTVIEGQKPAGMYTVRIDAKDLSSGVYIYYIGTGDFNQMKKMILIK